MKPPGRANALTTGESTTRNRHGSSGRSRSRRELEPELFHVGHEILVGVESHARVDFLGRILAHRDLVLLAHEHELALARHRVLCAGGQDEAEHGGDSEQGGPAACWYQEILMFFA